MNHATPSNSSGNGAFHAVDASSGQKIEPAFEHATSADVEIACLAAREAQAVFGQLPLAERAAFLRLCADKIDALGGTLTRRAMIETGLPEARLNGERGRTVGQLRLFAQEVEAGRWLNLRIDHADAGRMPPKPDLRMRMIPNTTRKRCTAARNRNIAPGPNCAMRTAAITGEAIAPTA